MLVKYSSLSMHCVCVSASNSHRKAFDQTISSITNTAYEMSKMVEKGSGEYEVVGKDAVETYEVPSSPHYHQPLPSIPHPQTTPTTSDVGVVKQGEEEGCYDNIPGDQ